MPSTRDNPGAYQSASTPALRSMLSRCLRNLRRGNYRAAGVGAAVDAANWLEARSRTVLPIRYRCSCCGYEAHAFRHVFSGGHAVWNSACPSCDSRSRHRGLAVLLPRLIDTHGVKRALHFAPEPVLRTSFARVPMYETADLYLEDATYSNVDIQQLSFPDQTYDFVVCNHVLEHVPNDAAALHELARILTTNGIAVLTVPGDFTREQTIAFQGDLPNGHYRDYGLDFVGRLRQLFASVESFDLHTLDRTDDALSRAIKPRDLAFVCRVASD